MRTDFQATRRPQPRRTVSDTCSIRRRLSRVGWCARLAVEDDRFIDADSDPSAVHARRWARVAVDGRANDRRERNRHAAVDAAERTVGPGLVHDQAIRDPYETTVERCNAVT